MLVIKAKVMLIAVATILVVGAQIGAARVDVRVAFDKTFDFKPIRTWAWNPQPGDVKMARTAEDDPEAARKRAEPIILEAVETEMSRLGFKRATSAPDLFVTYYLLLTTTMSAQTMGQFLPAVPLWGLPPFAPATQSLKFMNQGSLVLDLSAKGNVVWRGVAEAKIKFDADDKKRESLIREAVRDLLERYPGR
jgi:Domain of unknown function (DUF4136)